MSGAGRLEHQQFLDVRRVAQRYGDESAWGLHRDREEPLHSGPMVWMLCEEAADAGDFNPADFVRLWMDIGPEEIVVSLRHGGLVHSQAQAESIVLRSVIHERPMRE